jgi:hypothetical protein
LVGIEGKEFSSIDSVNLIFHAQVIYDVNKKSLEQKILRTSVFLEKCFLLQDFPPRMMPF